jgi:hypothetical protein
MRKCLARAHHEVDIPHWGCTRRNGLVLSSVYFVAVHEGDGCTSHRDPGMRARKVQTLALGKNPWVELGVGTRTVGGTVMV